MIDQERGEGGVGGGGGCCGVIGLKPNLKRPSPEA